MASSPDHKGRKLKLEMLPSLCHDSHMCQAVSQTPRRISFQIRQILISCGCVCAVSLSCRSFEILQIDTAALTVVT